MYLISSLQNVEPLLQVPLSVSHLLSMFKGRRCAMGKSLVVVIAMLELAAANVPNPSLEAWEFAFRLISTVTHVSVPGPVAKEGKPVVQFEFESIYFK
ncbi:hypothetical protein V6N13_009391 [Hibiscus sabdariffa]|uniref:Uncharacterized protein n=2 Tax=Hibiscus sabdariffa TaxID=183260 RepID=A0ABR2PNU8_9ROSI